MEPSSDKSGNSLNGKNKRSDDLVTINETFSLTKDQHQALKIVCDIYQQSFSEYIQEALVQAMRSDVEDGNISITLLERLEDSKREEKADKTRADRRKEETRDFMPFLDKLTRLNHRFAADTPK